MCGVSFVFVQDGIYLIDGLLSDAYRGRRERNAARGKEFQSGLEVLELEGGARVQFGLVRALLLEFVGDADDVDAEGHAARGEHVDDAVVDELDAELHLL